MTATPSLRWAAAALLLLGLLFAWLSVPPPREPGPVRARPSPSPPAPARRPRPDPSRPPPLAVPDADDLDGLVARMREAHPDLDPAWARGFLRDWVARLRGALDLPPLAPRPRGPSFTPGPPPHPRPVARDVVDAAAGLEGDGIPLLVAALTDGVDLFRERGTSPADFAADHLVATSGFSTTDAERLFLLAGHTELRARLVDVAARRRPIAEAALRLLHHALDDRQARVVHVALGHVARLDDAARALWPSVHALLEREDRFLAEAAAETLLRVEGPVEDVVRVIDDRLGSADPLARQRGVALIRSSGEAGRPLRPRLLPLLADEEPVAFLEPQRRPVPDRIAWRAVEALEALGARELVPDLERIARERSGRERIAAGLALLGLGAAVPGAIEILVEALGLDEGEGTTGWIEALALARAETTPPDAVTPSLVEAVAAKLSTGRSLEAGRALLRLGEAGRARARAVLEGVGSAYERHGVLAALLSDTGRARGFEDALGRIAASDENAWNREAATRVLGALEGR